MADKTHGRMIRKSISSSHGVSKLNPKSLSLFCLMIPHFNAHGKMNGSPYFIKGEVCPLVDWLDIKAITAALEDITAHTNVKWFKCEGLDYIHALSWDKHQEIRRSRCGDDSIPDYSRTTPGVIPDSSRSLPDLSGPITITNPITNSITITNDNDALDFEFDEPITDECPEFPEPDENSTMIDNYEMDMPILEDYPSTATPKKTTVPSVDSKKPYGEFENVNLTDAEVKKLVVKFGEPKMKSLVESLSQYLAKFGRDRYKSHYAVLLTWDRNATQPKETRLAI